MVIVFIRCFVGSRDILVNLALGNNYRVASEGIISSFWCMRTCNLKQERDCYKIHIDKGKQWEKKQITNP